MCSGCMEPVELASDKGEDPTAGALVLRPLAFDSHFEPRTGTLALLHFNENASRDQAQDRIGQRSWKRRLSKSRKGHFTARKVKAGPTFGYVAKLMVDVMARAGATSHKTSSKEIPSETRTFLTDIYEAPSVEELIAVHRPRFPDGCP
ncbi:hypothetical protein HPB49_013980 [Dermacentor silvarum]|uniref:Uncharacterized protein n=1 Tax=Dermacentor silvarum TaxID=543639 RepID=A0ACB8DPC5_DERSI|nr:hypothetical protein HPB49_013980 [Dermacentor silvarum]